MTQISAAEDIGALWLQTLQRALTRAAHDVKDALNGVTVNLEVIRTRAGRTDMQASAIEPFAEAAVSQLERLTTLVDAVLALGRPEPEPVDIASVLRRVSVLCSASPSSSDARVRVVVRDAADPTMSRVGGAAARVALAATLLDAATGVPRAAPASEVVCTISGTADDVSVRIAAAGRRLALAEHVAEAVRAAGVSCREGDRDITLTFPRG